MGQATLGGYHFRLDPEAIEWSYSVNTSVTDTVGGKVIQVFGISVNSMTVRGAFGRGGAEEARAFTDAMVLIAGRQMAAGGQPLNFVYPPKNWNFLVYLTGISDGSGSTYSESYDKFSHKYELELQIAEENSALKEIAAGAYLDRLARGIGWMPNEYNGPANPAEAQSQAAALGVTLTTPVTFGSN